MTPEEIAEQDARVEAAKAAEMAHHMHKIRKTERRAYTSLEEHQWLINFESLKIIDQNQHIVERVKKWDPRIHSRSLVLFGSVGTGKSTLCKALINKWASADYRCLFISVTDALKRIRSAIDSEDTTVEMECNKLIAPAMLVFDDLGVDNVTEWTREQIFSIFEARAHSKKHTFFTTNMQMKDIAKTYGRRISERLVEFCQLIKMDGDSFRELNYRNEI